MDGGGRVTGFWPEAPEDRRRLAVMLLMLAGLCIVTAFAMNRTGQKVLETSLGVQGGESPAFALGSGAHAIEVSVRWQCQAEGYEASGLVDVKNMQNFAGGTSNSWRASKGTVLDKKGAVLLGFGNHWQGDVASTQSTRMTLVGAGPFKIRLSPELSQGGQNCLAPKQKRLHLVVHRLWGSSVAHLWLGALCFMAALALWFTAVDNGRGPRWGSHGDENGFGNGRWQ